jgi:hypothetical protein
MELLREKMSNRLLDFMVFLPFTFGQLSIPDAVPEGCDCRGGKRLLPQRHTATENRNRSALTSSAVVKLANMLHGMITPNPSSYHQPARVR